MATETPLKPDELPLAADFPAASHEQWLQLVDKVLAGAPFEKKLVGRTYDGLKIQPLYTRDHWNPQGDPSGLPGGAPFTRGGGVLGDALSGWDIRQHHSHPDPATANTQIIEDLEHGVTSIVLRVDPTGTTGIAVQSAADFATVLKNVYLDLAPIVLEPATAPLPMAALLMHALEKRGAAARFIGNFGVDGFGTLAATGRLPMDIDSALARMGDVAAHAAATYPKARTFNVRTLVYHSAGATEALELGIALATAVDYLRAMSRANLDTDAACSQIAFAVAADADFFLTISKCAR